MKNKLPLLDFVVTQNQAISFKNCLLITCQHVLEANLALLDAFISNGLKPENIFLLGKTYSTNQEIAEDIKKRGIYIHPASTAFNSDIPFDEAHAEAVKDLLNYVAESRNSNDFESVIILDDGGQLIATVQDMHKEWQNVVAIEWTSSGFNNLQDKELHFPVINMARSQAKLTIESPFIAEHAIQKITPFLKKIANPNILVIGGGYIGASITAVLESKYRTHNYDIIATKSSIHEKELHSILGLYDVIIGCTGKTVIDAGHYQYLKKGLILASVSSSDREFSAVHLRKQVKKINSPHENIQSNDITLLNCGFPITFDGNRQPIALEKIQLTIALAFASVCQAIKTKGTKGFIELDKDVQQTIIDKFAEISN
ncbi:MAG: hypothetical protein HYZ63_02420 [Candidatus Andersenbacteria bacterium]|nr:hypothetical protein [Candidatus Andersenbacteria bacterium]